MFKKYEKEILDLLALGRRDLEQNELISNRETIVYADGKEITFPPPETKGISLNLDCDSARMRHKGMMRLRLWENPDIEAIFFLHYRVIYELADLVKHPNRLSLYVQGITTDEEYIFVRQDYTLDDSGKLVFGELTVLENDPEEAFLDHAFVAERTLGMSDEMFAESQQKMQELGFPKEWLDYVRRERKNRDEDEWYSPKRATDSSITDKKEGGHHEVSDAEETV